MKNFEQQLFKRSSSLVFHMASHQEVTGFRRVGNPGGVSHCRPSPPKHFTTHPPSVSSFLCLLLNWYLNCQYCVYVGIVVVFPHVSVYLVL